MAANLEQTNDHVKQQSKEQKSNDDTLSYWDGNSTFGFDLLHLLTSTDDDEKDSKNVFISPFSISSAFGLLMPSSDANTETSKEIGKVLHYPTDLYPNNMDLSKQIIEEQTNLVKDVDPKLKDEMVELNIANRIFYKESCIINKKMVETVGANNFEPMNFQDKDNASKLINQWIEKNTNDKIKEMMKPGMINDPIAFIINAIYLNAKWEYPFDKENNLINQSFYSDATRSKEIDNNLTLMKEQCSIYEFKYFEDDIYGYLRVPFKSGNNNDNQYYMLFILPNKIVNNKDKLSYIAFKEAITMLSTKSNDIYSEYIKKKFEALLNGPDPWGFGIDLEIELFVPKMKIESPTLSLTDKLSKLGINKAFSSNEAEFNDFVEGSNGPNIYIENVYHKTFFDMKEEGVEAAAVTVIDMHAESAILEPEKGIIQFKIDHPFYVAILAENTKDSEQKMLFLGKVNEVNA